MRGSIIAVVGSALLLLAVPALGTSKKDHDGCNQFDDYFLKSDACGRIIDDRGESVRNRATAYVNRGIAWHHFQKHAEALADLDQAIKLDPKNADAYAWRAAVYLDAKRYDTDQGKYDRAIADYGEAIRLDPKGEYYHDRGRLYRDKGDYDHAISDYSEAIKLDPKNIENWTDRAAAWELKGDPDHAIPDYDEAIKLNPKDASLHSRRGDLWVKKRDFDRAIADYSDVIRLDPKNTVAYIGRAMAYLNKRDLDRAIADFDQTIKLEPNSPANALVLQTRGDAWFAKGDVVRAIADYDAAIKLQPSSRFYASRCYVRAMANRDLTLALADCNESLRLDPKNNVGALNARGFVYLRLGRIDEAIADYDEAIKIYPQLPPSLYGRGLAKLKKADRAGSDADIAAAKATWADVAKEYAKYGFEPSL